MPITDIIILSLVVLAFLAFAVGLAWGDYQTREIARASREGALTGLHVISIRQKAGAESAGRAASERGKASADA